MPLRYWYRCQDCSYRAFRYRNVKRCPDCGSDLVRELWGEPSHERIIDPTETRGGTRATPPGPVSEV
jgi:hypothetical protein